MNANSGFQWISILAAISLPLLAGRLSAQDAAAPEIDIEARKQSIVNLEQHIKEREERLTEISQDIVRLDGRIEDRVTKIVAKLKSLKDSKDSGLRVTQTKEQVIAGLADAVDYYEIKRRGLKQELTKDNPAVSSEVLSKDIKVFDDKIEKRIDEIMKLTNSMATQKDYAKYVGSGHSNGWRNRNWIRKNPKYYHNRQQSSRSNLDRKSIAKALEDSVEDIKGQNRAIEVKLKTDGIPAAERDLLREERDLNDALIARREEQIGQLVAPKETGTRAIGGSEAHNMDRLIRDMADDIDEDFNTMFRYYTDLNRERAQIKSLGDNLTARKAWMEKHESGEAK